MYKEYRYGYPHGGCKQCIIDVTAENNKVARQIATWCLNKEHGFNEAVLRDLWDMNIVGVQIDWAYSYVCKSNNEAFLERVASRNKEFINKINDIAITNRFNQKAVIEGAFYSDAQGGLSLEKLQFKDYNKKTYSL